MSHYDAIVIPDAHNPWIDDKAFKVVIGAIEAVRPKKVIVIGDWYDCYALSRFVKNPRHAKYAMLDEEIKVAEANLGKVARAAGPKAELVFLQGNHEYRVDTFLAENALALFGTLPKTRDILRIPDRFSWVPYGRESGDEPHTFLGKLLVTHGTQYGRHVAAGMVSEYRHSVMFGHCFSDDTELLGPNGWVKRSDLRAGLPIATMNKTTKAIEFQPIQEVFGYDDYKEMVHIKSSFADHLVTPDHGLIFGAAGKPKIAHEEKAQMLTSHQSFWVSGTEDRPVANGWTDDELRLLVWGLADGSLDRPRGSTTHPGFWRWHLKKPRKIERLTALLVRLGIAHTVNLTKNLTTRVYVGRLDKKFVKRVPDALFRSLSARQATVVLEEWSHTDGTRYGGAAQLTTSCRITADVLQEISVRSGHKCNLTTRRQRNGAKDNYALSVRWETSTVESKSYNKGLVPYDGHVFCVSVENGTLLARRNGRVFVTANTHRVQTHFTRSVLGEVHAGFNIGWIGGKEAADYRRGCDDWTHAIGVVRVRDDGFFNVDIPVIVNGRTLVRGEEITA